MSDRILPDKATIHEPDWCFSPNRFPPTGFGQQGGQHDREREERKRQRREREKQCVAVNQADDKIGSYETTKPREVTPAALLFTAKHRSKGEIILLCQKKM
jgi:hypothetical protein